MTLIGREWSVPFCPDCGLAGKHAATCGMFPGEPVVHGNFENVVLASQLRGAVGTIREALELLDPDDDRKESDITAAREQLEGLASRLAGGR